MKLHKTTLIAFFLFLTGTVFSQVKQQGDQLVFLVKQKEHFFQVIKTIESFKKSNTSTIHASHTVIILCGELVRELNGQDLKISKRLEQAGQLETDVYACGLSLEKFNIPKESLPASVLYTENGLIKLLELQKAGYLSVQL
ncbi:hypothetical protein [Flavihumibacter sp. UBA7668]|uniref:hypothetical protein n=1 Tax=Flavihumibacter sp. UBA7668 TaxID=1946542 RepID=UPI0025BCBA1E|nr:hypothetical protein [Flavihumibacter sp. UBA7668]